MELGSAPGSWSQVMVERGMRVIAVDVLPMEPVRGCTFVRGDFADPSVQSRLIEAMGGTKVDLLASDMSPNRSGHASLDKARIAGLAEQALELARRCMQPSGAFVCKLLQGAEQEDLARRMRKFFGTVKLVKPRASRKESSELYVCARGFDPASFDTHWRELRT